MKNTFDISKINDELFARIDGKSFKKNCTLPVSDLRYLTLLHKNLNGDTLNGEMICNVKIAESLIDIFQKLYEASFPHCVLLRFGRFDARTCS